MRHSNTEKAAQRVSEGGPQEIIRLPGTKDFEVIPNLTKFQESHVARRFRVAPHVAAIIAEHAFFKGVSR